MTTLSWSKILYEYYPLPNFKSNEDKYQYYQDQYRKAIEYAKDLEASYAEADPKCYPEDPPDP